MNLVINQGTMACCGKPKAECTCTPVANVDDDYLPLPPPTIEVKTDEEKPDNSQADSDTLPLPKMQF